MNRHLWSAAFMLTAGCGGGARAATFVGSESCTGCHATEGEKWRGSHHALAMQAATDSTVLGRWDGASVEDAGIVTRFDQEGGGRRVTTAGPEGAGSAFTPRYTFGVYPLQQLLLPLSRGRLQALSVAWDARAPTEGGQRWYHLYGGDSIRAGHALHWASRELNWNYQCAECHSTDVRKGYVAATDSFATTFAEVSVGCEACHGPGSEHLRKADGRRPAGGGGAVGGLASALNYSGATWVFGTGDSIAHRSEPLGGRREVETCGRCHARRGVTAEGFAYGQPLLASHRPALLEEGLYWADGQIRDEVYEYGSFLQSRMSRAGVTCSDCHDPHSAARPAGNGSCAKCHLSTTFDAPRHTRHAVGTRAAQCVSCHMPATTYMGVDVRHDHSFRIPRPDLTVALGVPNACAQCHAAQGPQWAADRVASWTGRRRDPADHPGAVVARAGLGDPMAGPALLAIAADTTRPVMVRAAAYARVGELPTLPARSALARAAADPDPLIRFGVVRALDGFQPVDRLDAGIPLLRDTVHTIRIDAARAMAETREQLNAEDREALDAGLREWERAQRLNDDRADARTTLAGMYVVTGRIPEAEAELASAIRLDPSYGPAWVNFADLYRATGRDADALRLLRDGLARLPDDAALHHTYGLTLVRRRQLLEAVAELTRAVELAPDNARFAYVLAVALHDTGERGEAQRVVQRALRHHPFDRDLLEMQDAIRINP